MAIHSPAAGRTCSVKNPDLNPALASTSRFLELMRRDVQLGNACCSRFSAARTADCIIGYVINPKMPTLEALEDSG